MRVILLCMAGYSCLFGGSNRNLLAAEPARGERRELVATVLGEKIYLDQITPVEAREKRKVLSDKEYRKWLLDYRTTLLFSRVSGRLLEDYASREKLRPSDQEIAALVRDGSRKYLANPKLDEESKRQFMLRLIWVTASSREWRTAKALHEKYGGQVAVSSFGACIAIEGRNAVLNRYAARGELTFHQGDIEKAFRDKMRDNRVLDARVPPGDIKRFFAVSPWEREFNRPVAGNPAAKAGPANVRPNPSLPR